MSDLEKPKPVQKFCIKRVSENLNQYYAGRGVFERRLLLAQFYDTYGDAENVIKHLPNGLYQIDKIFAKVVSL